jgi:ketosteroid isomerase-like protein
MNGPLGGYLENGQKVTHRYLTVWQRQPAGAWKIFHNMPIPDDAPQ